MAWRRAKITQTLMFKGGSPVAVIKKIIKCYVMWFLMKFCNFFLGRIPLEESTPKGFGAFLKIVTLKSSGISAGSIGL